MRPTGLEVADIFRQIGPAYRRDHADSLSRGQRRVMSAIERCRTAALGGHVEECNACGHQRTPFGSGPRQVWQLPHMPLADHPQPVRV